MIRGIGVDIIEIKRIEEMIGLHGDRFTKKIFTDTEIAYCNSRKNPAQHYAARFAAKEAVSKALSTGWNEEFEWKNVEVVNDVKGKPDIHLLGKTADLLDRAKVYLSLSHSENSVVAFVVIEDNRR